MPVITPGERDYLSDPSILKEISKKNFIRENIKHLKQLERKNKDKKKPSKLEAEMPNVTTRRSIGKSKSQSKFGRKRILLESKSSKSIVKSLPKSPTTQVELSKAASVTKSRSHRSKKSSKAKGAGDAGTESEDDEIVRKISFPSQGKKKETKSLQTHAIQPQSQHSKDNSASSFSPFNIEDIKREMKAVQDIDYIKLNQLVQYKPKKHARNMKTDPNKAPPTYQKGVLPKYLRETKKDDIGDEIAEPIKDYPKSSVHQSVSNHYVAQNHSSKKSKDIPRENPKEVSSGNCPPGHILISENERKQQLNEMRKQYAELISKLHRLPVSDKKSRHLKNELENELENLEAAISLFSKEKLFVKIV